MLYVDVLIQAAVFCGLLQNLSSFVYKYHFMTLPNSDLHRPSFFYPINYAT